MTLRAFDGFGVEIEWMCVDRERGAVLPVVDTVLTAAAGALTSELDRGSLAWSNELTLHVLEMKCNGPWRSLQGLAEAFQSDVSAANALLAPLGGQLLPGGMHPTMDPEREMRLWPHDYSPVYTAFDRIFDCRGHGWANLQSVHLNLPFGDADEFGRLHAAIRVLLPLLPALAAASPVRDGVLSGWCDTRLEVYRHNARRVPLTSGAVVPEAVFTPGDYHAQVLAPLYAAIAPLDPDGVLQHEWLNARGAIARFDRDAIEIRVLDTQECPAADIGACAAIAGVLRALFEERDATSAAQRAIETPAQAAVLWAVARDADQALITDAALRSVLALPARAQTAGEVWRDLCDRYPPEAAGDAAAAALDTILRDGPMARRVCTRLGAAPDRAAIDACWRELAGNLAAGTQFTP